MVGSGNVSRTKWGDSLERFSWQKFLSICEFAIKMAHVGQEQLLKVEDGELKAVSEFEHPPRQRCFKTRETPYFLKVSK